MFSKIVLCSDGSEHAQQAGRVAAELAKRFQAQLTLLSVFNASSALAAFAMAPEAAPSSDVITALGEEIHCSVHQKTGGLLEQSAGFAPAIQDFRLGLEVAVIQKLAKKLNAGLLAGDPLGENVHLGKVQMLGVAASAIIGRSLARIFARTAAALGQGGAA